MSRSLSLLFLATLCFPAGNVLAQGTKGSIPPRLLPLAEKGPIRLTQILGGPEMQATFDSTMAFTEDGKSAIFVDDLSTALDDKLEFRSRVYFGDVGAMHWPREFFLPGKRITAIALAPDGSRALLTGVTKSAKDKVPQSFLTVLDLKTGKQGGMIPLGPESFAAIALSADGKSALTAVGGHLKLWNLGSGEAVRTFAKNKAFIPTGLSFLPGRDEFLAVYENGDVRRFGLAKDEPLQSYEAKGSGVLVANLAIASNGKRFVTGDLQQSVIKLWDVGGKEVGTFRRPASPMIVEACSAVGLAPDGKTVISVWTKAFADADDMGASRLEAWDGETNKVLWTRTVSYRGRVPMVFRGDEVLVGGGPNVLEAWKWKDGTNQSSRGGHKGPVHVIGTLADGKLISGGQDGSLLTWKEGELLRRESAHSGTITALTLAPDRSRWATAGVDREIYLWPAEPKGPRKLKKVHEAMITTLATSPDGEWLCSGSADRTARLWHLGRGELTATLAGHSEGVNAVAFSPDSRWIATASHDAVIKVWPIKNGKLDSDRETIVLEKHTKPVTALAFTPDGKRLLSGSQDQKLLVWDLRKGSMDFMILAHKNWITSILLLDGKSVVTASDDLTVAVWNLEDGSELGRVDLGTVGDCPRCLAAAGPGRFWVGTSSWLIAGFQFSPAGKSGSAGESSK